MSQYPRDEFDKVPETSARQGVHRERLIPSRSSGLGLLITVGVLALVIGLAAYFVLPRLGIGAGNPGPSAEAQATATPAPTASSEPADAEAEPEETAEPAPVASATPEPEPEPEPAVDRTQPVVVLNASGVSGLGASVSGRASGAGWAVGTVGNWTGAPQQVSAVYYGSPAQAANARQVGADLGIPTVVESPGFTNVTVVLAPGFR